jgi:hypothetical protein
MSWELGIEWLLASSSNSNMGNVKSVPTKLQQGCIRYVEGLWDP